MKFGKEGEESGEEGGRIRYKQTETLCKGCEARPVVERNWKLASVYRESLGLFRETTMSP